MISTSQAINFHHLFMILSKKIQDFPDFRGLEKNKPPGGLLDDLRYVTAGREPTATEVARLLSLDMFMRGDWLVLQSLRECGTAYYSGTIAFILQSPLSRLPVVLAILSVVSWGMV